MCVCACVTEIRTRRPADDDAQQQSYNILSSASSLSLSPASSPSRSRSAPESQSNYSTVRAINTLHINSDADAHKHWQTNQRPSPTNCLSKKERVPARVTERETGRECSACEKREQVFNFVIGVQLIADNDTLHCR